MIYKNILKYIKIFYHNIFVDYLMSPSGKKGLNYYGYKEYVGGDYENIGNLLSKTIINNLKLKKNDIFLDIGCGSLRVGKHIIDYLDKNKINYYTNKTCKTYDNF